MKKHFIHFFSTKCIVPIITEMQLFKVHTNKLRIEININGFSFEFAKLLQEIDRSPFAGRKRDS